MVAECRTAVIYYLFHSGFAVEIGEFFLVFDYFPHEAEGGGKGMSEGVLTPDDFIGRSNIYVFASHSHWDHFNLCVFHWYKANSKIRYVLSSDISKKVSRRLSIPRESVIMVEPYETIREEGLTVKTYGSTDVGVSFLVKTNGLSIFHAGDLNWWHWAEESTTEELMDAEAEFKAEIGRLAGERLDMAFFPVDPRLGRDYYRGGEYLIKTLSPKVFFPMHFAEKLGITQEFADRFSKGETRVIVINKRGQRIECVFP
jgi:L-ascorbate metabolism protein UlaG (beta-lactamase superfamily)